MPDNRNEEAITSKIAREYRIKFGAKMPTLTLARVLYKENKEVYNSIDHARTCLRGIEGKLGDQSRKKIDKTLILEGDRPKNPYNLPNSEEQEWKPYKIPDKCKRVLLLSDCVPIHSEVLTRDGWIKISDVTVGTDILTSDENKNLVFSSILNKVDPRIDTVYKFKRGTVNFEFTENHRHLYVSNYKNVEKKTHEVLSHVDLKLCATGYKNGGISADPNFCKLIGFIIGDGTRDESNWKIAVKKQRKIDYLDNIINNDQFTRNVNGDYVIYRLRAEFTRELDKFLDKNKNIVWNSFMSFDKDALSNILDGIINSDGAKKKDRPNIVVHSVKEDHIRFIQTLCHLTGLLCPFGTIYDNSESTYPSDNPLYSTTIYSNKSGAYHGSFVKETYQTEVTCVTVSSGFFLMRQNDNIVITGNCHIPYHSIDAITLALDYGKEKNVDTVILNGDTLDFYQLSRFEKDPRKRSLAYELDACKSFLKTLRELFPQATIIYKCGNHDVRLQKYLMIKAPELLGVQEFELQHLLKFKEFGVTWVDDKVVMKLKRLNIIHGHEFNAGFIAPVNIARGLFLKANACAIQGHNHATSENTVTTLDGDMITTWSTGCLCYSEDTEIMTQDGWKFFKDVSDNDKICIYDKEKNETRLSKPLARQVFEYDGEMVNFRGARIDALVTPNHKMIYYNHDGKLISKEADILMRGGGKYNYLSSAPFKSDTNFDLNWSKLCAWIVTEGTYDTFDGTRISIYQKKQEPLKQLLQLISDLNLSFKLSFDKRNGVGRVRFGNAVTRLIVKTIWDGEYTKRIPRKILNSDSTVLRKVFEVLVITDGHRRLEGSVSISSIDSGLINDYAEVIHKIGSTPKIYHRINSTKFKLNAEIYSVSEKRTDNVFSNAYERIQYKGRVYDFTSETGWLVVRRNNKVFISSNCELHPHYSPLNRWNLGFAYIEVTNNNYEVFNKRIKNGKVF